MAKGTAHIGSPLLPPFGPASQPTVKPRYRIVGRRATTFPGTARASSGKAASKSLLSVEVSFSVICYY